MIQKFFVCLLIVGFLGCFKAKKSPFDTTTPTGSGMSILSGLIRLGQSKVATPTFHPSAGVVTSLTNIAITTNTEGATIY